MNQNPKYYIVEASALPEVFLKVAEAKRLLATGEASTVNEAAKMTDISRLYSGVYQQPCIRDGTLPHCGKLWLQARRDCGSCQRYYLHLNVGDARWLRSL